MYVFYSYLSFGTVICVQSERRKSAALGYIFSQFSDSVCNFNASLLFGKEYAISDKNLVKLTALCSAALLVACSSQPRGSAGNNQADPQKFGAKYEGRQYQHSVFTPVAKVENQSAVINQGDF